MKGFWNEHEYLVAVKAAKKKWHRTRSLAQWWGGTWRWTRHKKAFAAIIALTWP
jgi:hypothetical protein